MLNRMLKNIEKNKSKYMMLSIMIVLLSTISIISVSFNSYSSSERAKLIERAENKIIIETQVGQQNAPAGGVNNDYVEYFINDNLYEKIKNSNAVSAVKISSNFPVSLIDMSIVTNSDKYIDFAEVEVTNISPVTKAESTNDFLVISDKLAKANEIKIGDDFTFELNSEITTLKVTDIMAASPGEENLIYCNESKLNNGLYDRAEINLTSAKKVETFYNDFSTEFDNYHVYLNTDYNNSVYLIINNMAEKILGIFIIFSVIILSFVVLFIVKDRKKEIGIYLMLGESRKKIYFKVLSEIIVVSLISITAAMILSYFLNYYLSYIASSSNYSSELIQAIEGLNLAILGDEYFNYQTFVFRPSLTDILYTYIIVIVSVILSTTYSLLSIIKYNEKDLLHIK